jgi:hypothetical protein
MPLEDLEPKNDEGCAEDCRANHEPSPLTPPGNPPGSVISDILIGRLQRYQRAAVDALPPARVNPAARALSPNERTHNVVYGAVPDRGPIHLSSIVNLAPRGMLVVSVARRLGSERPLLAYCAAPL